MIAAPLPSSRRSFFLPHSGHFFKGSSVNDWHSSKRCLQASHWYSYVGMVVGLFPLFRRAPSAKQGRAGAVPPTPPRSYPPRPPRAPPHTLPFTATHTPA